MRAFRHFSTVVIHGGRYHKTLLLVIESGLLYCVSLVQMPSPFFLLLRADVLGCQMITIGLFLSDNNGVYVITDMLSHLTVRTPLCLILPEVASLNALLGHLSDWYHRPCMSQHDRSRQYHTHGEDPIEPSL